MKDIMTPQEVANYLRISRWQVYRLIKGGQLKYANTSIGLERKGYRITRENLEDFLNGK